MLPCNSHQLYTSWTAEGEKGLIECPIKLADLTQKKERARKDFCSNLKTTSQQIRGTESTTVHKGWATSGIQKTQQGDLGLNKRKSDRGFQTRKKLNSPMFTARKLKQSIGRNKTFHVVKFSGIEHSFPTLRSLSTNEGRKRCPNTMNSYILLFWPSRLQVVQVMNEKPAAQ